MVFAPIGPAVSTAARQVLKEPAATRIELSLDRRFGFLGTTLTTPPIAPFPNITDAGPPSTSMRSTIHGSKGNGTVLAPTSINSPSNNCITDPVSLNPRAASPLPPLPGLLRLVTPTACALPSTTVCDSTLADRLAREDGDAGRCLERRQSQA